MQTGEPNKALDRPVTASAPGIEPQTNPAECEVAPRGASPPIIGAVARASADQEGSGVRRMRPPPHQTAKEQAPVATTGPPLRPRSSAAAFWPFSSWSGARGQSAIRQHRPASPASGASIPREGDAQRAMSLRSGLSVWAIGRAAISRCARHRRAAYSGCQAGRHSRG